MFIYDDKNAIINFLVFMGIYDDENAIISGMQKL